VRDPNHRRTRQKGVSSSPAEEQRRVTAGRELVEERDAGEVAAWKGDSCSPPRPRSNPPAREENPMANAWLEQVMHVSIPPLGRVVTRRLHTQIEVSPTARRRGTSSKWLVRDAAPLELRRRMSRATALLLFHLRRCSSDPWPCSGGAARFSLVVPLTSLSCPRCVPVDVGGEATEGGGPGTPRDCGRPRRSSRLRRR
jgi:hypothetical protein